MEGLFVLTFYETGLHVCKPQKPTISHTISSIAKNSSDGVQLRGYPFALSALSRMASPLPIFVLLYSDTKRGNELSQF